MSSPDTLTDLIELHSATTRIADATFLTLPEAVHGRQIVERIRKHLADIIGEIDLTIIALTADAADDNDHRIVEVDEKTTVSIKRRPSKVSTDWPRLLPVAAARIVDSRDVDPETGEIMRPEDKIVEILPKLVPMTASVNAKKTGAKLLGIDLDDFQTKEWSGLSVRLIESTS